MANVTMSEVNSCEYRGNSEVGDASEEEGNIAPKHEGPSSVRIIKTFDENHQFQLDEDALSSVLLSPDVIDKKVSISKISYTTLFRACEGQHSD